MPALIILALFFHILSAVIWVGGMFFAYMMLRPVAGGLDPLVRLPLWRGVFARFFPWVWAAVIALIASGFLMMSQGIMGRHVDIMVLLGIIMMLLFAHLYFAPWRRFTRALDAGDKPAAAAALDQIRGIVRINLVIGLLVVVIGATGRYWG